jgi:hypothetical protein
MMGGQGMVGGQGMMGGQGMGAQGMMGGQGMGNRGMGGMSNPDEFFDRLSGGKDFWSRNEITDDRQRMMFDMMAQRMGVTNGVITRQQFQESSRQYLAQRGQGGPGQPGSMPGGNRGQGWNWNPDFAAESLFRQLDQNQDGVLNYDEMPDSLRQELSKWDLDSNGLVDLEEFKAFYKARMAQLQAERGGQPGAPGETPTEEDKKPVVWRAGKLPKELPPWFRQMDTDNDGQVGLYEWKRAGGKVDDFFAIDINSDGFITVEEALRSVGKLNTATLAAAETAQTDGTVQPNSPRGNGPPGRTGRTGMDQGNNRFQRPGMD